MNRILVLCVAKPAATVVAVPLLPWMFGDPSSIKIVERRLGASRKSAP